MQENHLSKARSRFRRTDSLRLAFLLLFTFGFVGFSILHFKKNPIQQVFSAKKLDKLPNGGIQTFKIQTAPALENGVVFSAAKGNLVPKGSQFLFQSVVGERYFWLASQYADAQKSLNSKYSIFKNQLGRLQSTQIRAIDPGVVLQWHHFAWPSFSVDRFPFSQDQSNSAVRDGHSEEKFYWKGEVKEDIENESVQCPKHNPVALNSSGLWGIKEKSGNSSIILQDSRPDDRHFEFENSIQFLDNLGNLSQSKSSLQLPQPDDHGTHMAGLISARLNDRGIAGVSPDSNIISVPLELNHGIMQNQITLKNVLEGLGKIHSYLQQLTIQNRLDSLPRVIFLGYAFEALSHDINALKPLRDAVEVLLNFDVAVVMPAGNILGNTFNQALSFPAAYSWKNSRLKGVAVAISASDLCSDLANFSKVADITQVLTAPGERIYSTFVNNDFGFLSGTSPAAAQVAGVLVWAASRYPQKSMKNIFNALKESALVINQSKSQNLAIDATQLALVLPERSPAH